MKIFIYGVIMLLSFSCDDSDSSVQGGSDHSYAQEVLDGIEDYSSWSQTDSWTGVKASLDGTHGEFVQIWFNDIAYSDVEGGSSVFQEGSIIVKEGYSDQNGTSGDQGDN